MSKQEFREKFKESLQKEIQENFGTQVKPSWTKNQYNKERPDSHPANDFGQSPKIQYEYPENATQPSYMHAGSYEAIVAKQKRGVSTGLFLSIIFLLAAAAFFGFAGYTVYNNAEESDKNALENCKKSIASGKEIGIEIAGSKCFSGDTWKTVFGKSLAEENLDKVKGEIVRYKSKMEKEILAINREITKAEQDLNNRKITINIVRPRDNVNLQTDLENRKNYLEKLKELQKK